MRSAIALALVLIALLAGCLGDDAPDDAPEGDMQGDPGASGGPMVDPGEEDSGADDNAPENTTGSNATNRPPAPAIDTDLDGGEAPLMVNFTFRATDADNDTLSWEVDLDGDGEADDDGIGGLPVNATHTFEDVGNHTVTFTVLDAETSVNATVVIQVIEPVTKETEAITFSGSIVSPDPFVVGSGICIMPLADFVGSGTWGQVYAAPDGIDGWGFSLDHDAAVATFLAGDTPGSSGNSGTVSNGPTDIMVCASEPLVDYTLTLTPS